MCAEVRSRRSRAIHAQAVRCSQFPMGYLKAIQNMREQCFLTAAVQNIKRLIKAA